MLDISKVISKLALNKIDKNSIIINTVDITFSNGWGIYSNPNIHTNSKVICILAGQSAPTSIIVATSTIREGSVDLVAYNADATHIGHTGNKTVNIIIYNI